MMYPIATIIDNIRLWIIEPIFFGLAIIMFLYAGILFLIAEGDPSKLTKARQAVLWGVIGIVVGLLGYGIAGLLRSIVGV